MELSELQEIRRQKADEFRSRDIEPYPTRSHRYAHIPQRLPTVRAATEASGEAG